MKATFIALVLVLSPFAASAQVIINRAALDQLAGIPPVVVTAPPEIRQPPRKVTYRPVPHKRITAPPEAAGLASSRIAPELPVAPPPAPVTTSKPNPPVKPAAPQAQLAVVKAVTPPAAPPPAAPKPAAPASAAITFSAGTADLPPGISAQLKPFCTSHAPGGPITIDAYAAADPSDPSAAPRLSMARAFALRDALTACGIPSASIIPRANGVGKNPNIAEISGAP